ncbi:LLM class flavin-dependent oxidoreductase [Leifsonia flava]|uniref:LLM class flavin-dependent oxidoreductase n=1 Tax=Orlajensenia leifsoniae TaxID=2561933 RepID=A0A4Y9R4W0_9MICO|nr:LLM class flavin-dependent oxidoreductase [Leifsonia flava]TFV98465.1 LLM class flavin-dependent oxidoreductase [Leifsonia flava]
MSTTPALVSLGLAGVLDRAAIRELAVAAEAAGLHALWLNDTPNGEALAGLAAAAEVTDRLVLATGVIPFDRWPASVIAERVRDLSLPQDRLVLGVGSGSARRPLALVTPQLDELQRSVEAPVLLGALGPKMRELAATRATGALLSWLPPEIASETAAALRETATDAARPRPRAVLYARGIVDPEAADALAEESARYGSYPSYAANFERLGIGASDTTITGTSPEALRERLDAYRAGVDELVFRAITADGSTPAYRRIIDALAEAAR